MAKSPQITGIQKNDQWLNDPMTFTNPKFQSLNMETNRKHLLDKFQEHLQQRFESWCQQHGVPISDDRLLTYLIDQELIPTSSILRYTVLREIEALCLEQQCQKTQSVGILANRFNLSERTIWNIIKNGNALQAKNRNSAPRLW